MLLSNLKDFIGHMLRPEMQNTEGKNHNQVIPRRKQITKYQAW